LGIVERFKGKTMAEQVLTCFDICPDPVVITIPENNMPQAPLNGSGGGGGDFTLFTSDSDQVSLNGDGTSGNPLMATLISGQTINFEIAVGRAQGMQDGDILAVYAPAKDCTIPADLVGSEFNVTGQNGDVLVNLLLNGVVVGNISIPDGGTAVVDLASDIVLGDGDILEVAAGSDAEFSLLAVTLLGLRTLDYVP
jgi:hypothetical protein